MTSTAVVESPVAVAELVAAVRRQQVATSREPTPRPATTAMKAAVLGAHAGAGASSVAVAMLDALVARGVPRPTLVDTASPAESGLIGAAECEIESGHPAWRGGRRGAARILRSALESGPATDWPEATGPMIIDGRPQQAGTRTIMVCRATVPSLRRAESMLLDVRSAAAVAVVGVTRWPKPIAASLGAAIADATRAGHVVFVPHNRDLELFGIEAEPTPDNVLKAGLRLVDLLWPDLDGSSSTHRKNGLRR